MIREKDILSAISEFFVRLTTNQYIDGILTFRNDLKIRQSKKLHFVNDTDVTNATIEYDSSVNKVKINKPTQVNGADVLTTNDVDSDLSSSSVKPVQNKTIKNALDSKSDNNHNHNFWDLENIPIINYPGDPNAVVDEWAIGLPAEVGTICVDEVNNKVYILTEETVGY